MIEFTPAAVEVLEAATRAARRFNPEAMVRIARALGEVKFELTDEVGETDERMVVRGFTVLAQDGLQGTVDVGEHNEPKLLPPK